MQKLYQRLFNWARVFASQTQTPVGRVIHTEVTIERQGLAVLTGDLAAEGFQNCPLCGQKLQPHQAKQAQQKIVELRQAATATAKPMIR